MTLKRALAITAVVALCALAAAALLPGESNGGTKSPRTIGLINEDGAEGFVGAFETGGRSAATALGDQLDITRANDTPTRISRFFRLSHGRAPPASRRCPTNCALPAASGSTRRARHSSRRRSPTRSPHR